MMRLAGLDITDDCVLYLVTRLRRADLTHQADTLEGAVVTGQADVALTIQKWVLGAARTGSLSGDENSSQKSRNARSEPAKGPSSAWMLRTSRTMHLPLLRQHDPVHYVPSGPVMQQSSAAHSERR